MRAPYSYRVDAAVPAFPDDKPIIIFDGHCALCSGFVRFVLNHDRTGAFRLLPAQSPLGEAIYRHFGLSTDDYETNILLDGGRAYFASTGSLRMMRRLPFPWSVGAALLILPRPLRDAFYRVIARNRLRWFGRREACYRVEPGMEDRFLR